MSQNANPKHLEVVERLFNPKTRANADDRLRSLGVSAVAALRQGIADPRTGVDARMEHEAPTDFQVQVDDPIFDVDDLLDHSTVFEALADLLAPWAVPEDIDLVEPYLSHPGEYVAAGAAKVISSTGHAQATTLVRRALKMGGPVAEAVFAGLELAHRAERLDLALVNEVWPELIGAIGEGTPVKSAAVVLLSINPERAKASLLTAEVLQVDQPNLALILQGFVATGTAIPLEHLTRLRAELAERIRARYAAWPHEGGREDSSHPGHPNVYPLDRALGFVLGELGNQADRSHDALLREELTSPSPLVRSEASHAILASHGLDVLWEFSTCDFDGESSIHPVLLGAMAVSIYKSEVENGGHEQYFYNSSADTWVYALETLRAIGETERAGVLDRATRLFGRKGPPQQWEKRQEALADIDEDKLAKLNQLDDEFYEIHTDLEPRLNALLLEHEQSLREWMAEQGIVPSQPYRE